MSDESRSQTAKLPPAPPPSAPPQGDRQPPPGPTGPPAPSAPPRARREQPAPPAPPQPTAAPRPTILHQPVGKLPVAPPVGPPRFPGPGRRRGDKAPQPIPEEAAKEAELKEEESAELIAQRDRLLEKFTVMQADLGGAFYEMAIRDHVRLDVLTRKAAELQRVDAELLAVERLLELERADAAGLCPGCGAPYGPAVRFCAQCGTPLVPTEAGS
jgi:hypothetical protein